MNFKIDVRIYIYIYIHTHTHTHHRAIKIHLQNLDRTTALIPDQTPILDLSGNTIQDAV